MSISMCPIKWYHLLLVVHVSLAVHTLLAADSALEDDTDLTNFITRPELKVPRLDIKFKADHGISDGYWFLAPYAKIEQQQLPLKYYQACSTGPAIYDNDGELVWSGACLVQNSNVMDFRAFTDDNGVDYLTTMHHGNGGVGGDIDHKATVVDNTYNFATARNLSNSVLEHGFNMHEFKVVNGGRSALYLTYNSELIDLRGLNLTSMQTGWVSNIGFREVDVATGDIIFEWTCLGPDKLSPTESTVHVDETALWGPWPKGWNWIHPNSVDKSPDGDYLVSGRFVDTVYKISGKNGTVLWRLGGKLSDFDMVGFNFSKQHDAQFVGNDPESGAEIISLFDNAKAINVGGINTTPTTNVSSGLIVALDKKTWTAKLVHRIDRPDGGITALRGNFQHLANGNKVGGWSENGYFSEHAPDGRLVFEAKFPSKRFVNYRTYKHTFTGIPTEAIALKAFVYGETKDSSTTVWYVSWNGATEVVEWRFCKGDPSEKSSVQIVGSTAKSGFETIFQSDGVEESVFVEALAKNGSVVGRSEKHQAIVACEWQTEDSANAAGDELAGDGEQWDKSEL